MPLTVSLPNLIADGSDSEFRRLVHGLFAFLARHESIRDGHAERIGLAGVEYTVLIAIAHLSKNTDVSVKTVADHMRVSGTFITRVVNRLIKLGLIQKKTFPLDRRRVQLTLLPAGRKLLHTLAPTQRKVNNLQFGPLTTSEFQMMISIIERLIASSDQALALQAYLKSLDE